MLQENTLSTANILINALITLTMLNNSIKNIPAPSKELLNNLLPIVLVAAISVVMKLIGQWFNKCLYTNGDSV